MEKINERELAIKDMHENLEMAMTIAKTQGLNLFASAETGEVDEDGGKVSVMYCQASQQYQLALCNHIQKCDVGEVATTLMGVCALFFEGKTKEGFVMLDEGLKKAGVEIDHEKLVEKMKEMGEIEDAGEDEDDAHSPGLSEQNETSEQEDDGKD